MKNILLLFLVMMMFSSCEETMVMIPDNDPIVTEKTVLIEDLTGVQCPNCPKGTAAIDFILEAFGANVMAIGIHGTLQAEPIPNESKYDFRNPFAQELEEFHKPWFGKPTALINRVKFDGEINIGVINIDLWFGLVEQELNRDNKVNVLLSKEYNEATNTISIEATIIPIEDIDGEYRVSVFVTESDIEDPQETQTEIIEDYIHNHVLRHMMTNVEGDVIGDDLKEGEIIKRNFSYEIDESFNTDHMDVIVSVHKGSSSDKSILQSALVKVKE